MVWSGNLHNVPLDPIRAMSCTLCTCILHGFHIHTRPRPRNLADLIPLPGPLRDLGRRFEISAVD
ncbi:hypothetical protein COCC4DRAFT_123690 [Bipolaris maydis ATCC 48331]|uniref:Uncharacterized protein n=2 Tax=Cochliobolus heterostrophus TaxID=5016 RepID=M2TFN4_COCH5|nr:uncharacterized protein COCC4DRAFT_123690 [Bipolaris maydis ATCC 48331]EMD96265.1 hypothetical protein COCHEDRAFT_1191356 [Bipolaris maydis C5]ENI11124.1 hypothetical protein COCC4DRAFT_123690 [Bipolaris maydis ATCC 48331]KAJ6212981.1 hypothetical protein PSV09DRAFT_1191356 [Bipolaris maydis]